MALYQSSTYLHHMAHEEFDKIYRPGATVAWSGIYRCDGCGREIVHTASHPLPPQNHHQHNSVQGSIRWRLIVTDSVSHS